MRPRERRRIGAEVQLRGCRISLHHNAVARVRMAVRRSAPSRPTTIVTSRGRRPRAAGARAGWSEPAARCVSAVRDGRRLLRSERRSQWRDGGADRSDQVANGRAPARSQGCGNLARRAARGTGGMVIGSASKSRAASDLPPICANRRRRWGSTLPELEPDSRTNLASLERWWRPERPKVRAWRGKGPDAVGGPRRGRLGPAARDRRVKTRRALVVDGHKAGAPRSTPARCNLGAGGLDALECRALADVSRAGMDPPGRGRSARPSGDGRPPGMASKDRHVALREPSSPGTPAAGRRRGGP